MTLHALVVLADILAMVAGFATAAVLDWRRMTARHEREKREFEERWRRRFFEMNVRHYCEELEWRVYRAALEEYLRENL